MWHRPRMEKSHSKRHELSFCGLVSIFIVLIVPQKSNHLHYWQKSFSLIYAGTIEFRYKNDKSIVLYVLIIGLIPFLWNIFYYTSTVRCRQECDFSILGRWRIHIWRDSFICYGVWHNQIWHDAFIRDVTHSYVMRCDTFRCGMTHSHATWLIHMWRGATRSDVACRIHIWNGSFICDGVWHIQMWHDTFIRDVTHSCVAWCEAFIRGMLHSYTSWHIPIRCDAFMSHMYLPKVDARLTLKWWRDSSICKVTHSYEMWCIHVTYVPA